MNTRRIIQISISSAAVILAAGAAIFAHLNERNLELLDVAITHHSIDRITMGTVLWSFETRQKHFTVFVPPTRLQGTFNSVFGAGVPIEYRHDLSYWFLLATCFVPSCIVLAFASRQNDQTPKLPIHPEFEPRAKCARYQPYLAWLLVPACMLTLVYCLGIRIGYHTKDAEIVLQLRPALSAVAIERSPVSGSNPEIWVSHLRGLSICTHETTTCAGHICDERCGEPHIDLAMVSADSCFPFDTVND